MKLNFGEGGFVGFLSQHCEKFVFGAAVLLVVWIALPDSERTPIDEDQGPSSLVQKVTRANERLDTESWPTIREERVPTEDRYTEAVRDDLLSVSPSGYPADVPLDKPLFPPQIKRDDPKLYPVEELEVAVVYGPLVLEKAGAAPVRRGREEEAPPGTRSLPFQTREQIERAYGIVPPGGREAVGATIVAIKGLVPIRKQQYEYDSRFKEAADYHPSRDVPNYGAGEETSRFGTRYYYAVERAEVGSDGNPGTFKTVGNSYIQVTKEKEWTDNPVREVADERYVDHRFAMDIPPLMLRDLEPIALHSDIPSASEAIVEEEPMEEPAEDAAEQDETPMDIFGPALGDDEPSEPPPSERRPTSTPKTTEETREVDYRLFRFFDMDVEPGKAYVYRVKLYLEDPNDPSPSHPKPPLRVMEKSVVQRISRKPKASVWWRETPYSETSAVVRTPSANQDRVLVGDVDPGKVTTPTGEKFRIRQREESAKVMTLVWDQSRALDVPGKRDVHRGAVLNFDATVEAIDAGDGVLRELTGYPFRTDDLVLDIRGGEELGRNSELTAPGEVLLIDREGRLFVQRQLEDRTMFRIHDFRAAETEEPGGRRLRPRPGGGGLLNRER